VRFIILNGSQEAITLTGLRSAIQDMDQARRRVPRRQLPKKRITVMMIMMKEPVQEASQRLSKRN